MNCDNCKHTRTCTRVWRNSKKDCPHYIQTTNADHIRSMTDEELAKWLDEDLACCCYCSEDERLENEPLLRGEKCDEQCKKHLLDWLKQPYKEET